MRTTTTLLLVASFSTLMAQAPGDSLYMFFDQANESLHLDSVYPAGCWQVGTPAKTVFTSAYSPGRALVTDTVLPYPDSTTCYAEFTLVATNSEYLGRSVFFEQRRELAPSTLASIEVMNSSDIDWHRFGMFWDENLLVDGIGQTNDGTGFTFSGQSTGWEEVWLESPCIGVFWNEGNHGPDWYDPVMRVRFVFQSQSNPNGMDGWMIDNVRAGVSLCSGGIDEPDKLHISTYPDPATTACTLDLGLAEGAPYQLQMVRSDGAVLLSEQRTNTGIQTLNVSSFAEGPYVLFVTTDTQRATQHFVVQR